MLPYKNLDLGHKAACIWVCKEDVQLEAGMVKLQSRLEEDEQAKATLMVRIQRLTKPKY